VSVAPPVSDTRCIIHLMFFVNDTSSTDHQVRREIVNDSLDMLSCKGSLRAVRGFRPEFRTSEYGFFDLYTEDELLVKSLDSQVVCGPAVSRECVLIAKWYAVRRSDYQLW